MAESIVLYGAGWCADCRRSRAALDRLNEPYEYIDIEHDEDATQRARSLSGVMSIPVVVFPDSEVLVEPSDAELSAKVLALRGGSAG